MNDHLSPILRKKTLELDYSSIIGVNLHLLTVCQNASMCQTYSPENVFTCRQRTHRMTWKWKEPHCLWTTDVPREPKLMRERERWWWRDKRQNNLAKGGERNVEEKTIGEGMQGRGKKRHPQGVLLTLDLMDNSSSMHLVCLCAYACSMWILTWISVHIWQHRSVKCLKTCMTVGILPIVECVPGFALMHIYFTQPQVVFPGPTKLGGGHSPPWAYAYQSLVSRFRVTSKPITSLHKSFPLSLMSYLITVRYRKKKVIDMEIKFWQWCYLNGRLAGSFINTLLSYSPKVIHPSIFFCFIQGRVAGAAA